MAKGVLDTAAMASLGNRVKKRKGVFPPLRPILEELKKVNRFWQTQLFTPHPPVRRKRRGTLWTPFPHPTDIALRGAGPDVEHIKKLRRQLGSLIKKGRKGGARVHYIGKRRGIVTPLKWNSHTNRLERDYSYQNNPFIVH